MTQKEGPSVEANMNYELTSDQEEELDRIVDTTGCSYYYAKRLMGLPVEDPKEVGNLIKRVPSPREVGKSLCKDFSAAIVVGI